MHEHNYCVLICHDGKRFVAQVLDRPDCIGYGATHAEALRHVAMVMMRRLRTGEPAADAAPSHASMLTRKPPERRHIAPAKALLLEKFGHLSNREIAARIGVVERDAPVMLSMALAGRGSRRVRCAIARALGDLPSKIWPDRPARFLRDDDAEYSDTSPVAMNARLS